MRRHKQKGLEKSTVNPLNGIHEKPLVTYIPKSLLAVLKRRQDLCSYRFICFTKYFLGQRIAGDTNTIGPTRP